MAFRLTEESRKPFFVMLGADALAVLFALINQYRMSGLAQSWEGGGQQAVRAVARSGVRWAWLFVAAMIAMTAAYAWLRRQPADDPEMIKGLPPEQD